MTLTQTLAAARRWIVPLWLGLWLGFAVRAEILTDTQRQWLTDHPNLRIGFTIATPPHSFRRHDSVVMEGLCIDYLNAVEGVLNYKFEQRSYPTWQDLITAFEAHEIDVVYVAQPTPAWQAKYLFSSPYLTAQNVILAARNTRQALTVPSLSGKKVAVVKGNSTHDYLRTQSSDIILVPVEDELTGLLKLSFHEVDAMAAELSRAIWIIDDKNITNIRVAGLLAMDSRLGYMFHKEQAELNGILDAAIGAIAPQTAHSIIGKWTHSPASSDWGWLWWTFGLGFGGVLIFGVWNLTLHRKVEQRTAALKAELRRRHETEKKRSIAEEQFRHTIEFCPLGVHMWQLEKDGRIILTGANTAAEKILRLDHHPLIGKELCDAFPGLVGTDIPDRYRQVCFTGIPFSDMQMAYQDDRVVGVYEVFAFQTAPGQMAAMFTDISERMAAQEAMRQSEGQLSSIFSAAPAAIGVAVNRFFVQVNDQMCRMLGYSREELLDQSAQMVYVSPEEFERVGDEIAEQLRVSRTGSVRTQWRCKNGEILDILFSAAEIDPNDLSKGATFVALDISEQVRTRGKLEESERHFRAIFEQAPLGVAIIDSHTGRFLQINAQYSQMVGYTVPEMLSRDFAAITHPDDLPADQANMARLRSGEIDHFSMEKRYCRKDGSLIWVHLSVVPLWEKGHTPTVHIAMVFDITESKQAAETLRQSEQRLREAQRVAQIGNWELNHRTGELYWSDEVYRIFELDKAQSDTIRDVFYGRVHPDDVQMVHDAYEDSLRQHTSYKVDHRIVLPDGRIKFVRERCENSYSPDGAPLLSVGTVQDITEQKQVEEKLKFFMFAVEHSGEAAYWMDRDGRMKYVNQAACKQLGYTREEMLTMSVHDIDPDFPKEIWPEHWQQLRQQKNIRLESRHKAKDGTITPTEVSANHVVFSGVEYNCAFVREIPERKQFENAIDAFVQTVSSCVGQDVFRAFARQLAAQLGADAVIIGRVATQSIQTLAFFKDGALHEDFVYAMEGAPCQATLSQAETVNIIPDHIAERFPQDAFFAAEGIESYIGIPLVDVEGRRLGLICVMFRKPLTDTAVMVRILKIFASQAVMELQRMEGQQELANSEHRFREMFTRMTSAVAIYQPVDDGQDFVFVDFNPAAERVDKIDKGSLLGRRVTEMFPGIEQFGLLEVFRQVWKTGQSAHHPVGLYKDNRFASYRDNSVYKLPTGEIVSLYDDMTEQVMAQEQIRRNAERLQVVLNLNQMIDQPLRVICDFALEEAVRITQSSIGYITFVDDSQTVLTMYSWSKNAMAQCGIEDKPVAYQLEDTGQWGEAVRQRQPIVCNDYAAPSPLKRGLPKGHVQLTRHMSVPIFSGSKIVMVVGVGNKNEDYDQTDTQQLTLLMDSLWHLIERIEARQATEKLLAELQSKNRELESIVFVASHDLRSPLINIQGFAGELTASCRHLNELLGRETLTQTQDIHKLLDDEIPESLRFISAGATKMDALVKGLLQIARIGTAKIQIEPVDMNRLLATVISTVQYQMRENHISIRVGDLPRCLADRVQLNQVFTNLIDNAIKYRHPDRQAIITVDGQVQGGRVVYTIRDNGIGIDPEHCEKIFEIFHRLNPTGAASGEGLGLTIVRRTLDRMDGTVAVESTLGQGATFTVNLPVADSTQKQ